MVKQVQIRRGTTAENNEFTGAQGEITMDTDKNQIRLHDGVTQGGIPFGDTVVEWQLPTAANNYTWYRKYASGWVEQGGSGVAGNVTITLPIPMADNHYTATMPGTTTYSSVAGIGADAIVITKTTTTIKYGVMSAFGFTFDWQVSGMAA